MKRLLPQKKFVGTKLLSNITKKRLLHCNTCKKTSTKSTSKGQSALGDLSDNCFICKRKRERFVTGGLLYTKLSRKKQIIARKNFVRIVDESLFKVTFSMMVEPLKGELQGCQVAKHRFVERKGELRKQKGKLKKSKTLSKKKTLICVTPDALTRAVIHASSLFT